MGVMSETATAILEHKKLPFLKAFIRTGKVAPATRAVRISRDAVYDWLRADSSFRRQFNQAKKSHFDHETGALAECFEFFLSVVKPIVTSDLYTRIVAATNLKLTTRKFKVGSSSTARAASRKVIGLPSFDAHPESANSVNGGSRGHTGKNGSLT